MHHGNDRFRLAGEQEFAEIHALHLAVSRPARQVNRIAAGRAQCMSRQHFADQTQIFIGATIRAERNAGFALRGQRVQGQGGFVDAHRLQVLREQNLEAEAIFGRKFVAHGSNRGANSGFNGGTN